MWWKPRNYLVYEQNNMGWFKMYVFFRPCTPHLFVPRMLNKHNKKRKGRRGK